jgi:hypothetical protein
MERITMDNLTKDQAIIISGYTMRLICNFSDLHADIEKRLGRPVFTSELPHLQKEIEDAYREDFVSLQPDD